MISNIFFLSLSVFGIIIGITVFLLLWNKPVLVIYIHLIYCCFIQFLISHLHLPEMIKFGSDLFIVIILLQVILQFNKTKTLNIRKPIIFIFLYLLVSIISSLINSSSILFFILGLRAHFRLFVYFFACTIFLTREDIDKLIKFFLTILPINTLIVFFQFFVLGLEDDYIGGIFGTQQSCNAESNIYLTIVSIIALLYYVNKKINLWYCIIIIMQTTIIAAISELKVMFFSLIIILLIIFILTFPNKRAITITVTCFLVLILGLILLLFIYPIWFNIITDFGAYLEETGGKTYGTADNLGRTYAGPYVFENILIKPTQKLFGVGLGYGDRYLSMESSFFSRYSVLSYYFFAYAIILIEIGLMGLIIYCFFFLTIMYESMRIRKVLNNEDKYYCYISFITSLFVFQSLIYNQSIFYDGAFIIFFVLSFPFIMEKDSYENSILAKSKHDTANPI